MVVAVGRDVVVVSVSAYWAEIWKSLRLIPNKAATYYVLSPFWMDMAQNIY